MSDQKKTKAQKLEIVKKQLEEELQLENFGVTKEQLDNIAEIICKDNNRFFAYFADANSLGQTSLLSVLSGHNLRLHKLEIDKKCEEKRDIFTRPQSSGTGYTAEKKAESANDKSTLALLFATVSIIISVASIWLS